MGLPHEYLLWAMLVLPLLGAIVAHLPSSPRTILGVAAVAVFATAGVGVVPVARVFALGPVEAAGGWLRVDALGAWHLALMFLVFCAASVYALTYFARELDEGTLPPSMAQRFAGLWCGTLAAMVLTLTSNNLGLMWVGIEGTTVLTAFLVSLHVSKAALEATWKYLIVCSIGVGLAFMGTLLLAAAGTVPGGEPADAMLWTNLQARAGTLDPQLAKAAFIFVLVGYGTKAGLAPLHNWLPDAHSQAPAPVSALFSGFMLNAALYGIMRFLPLVEAATGNVGFGHDLLALFGVGSVLLASAFMVWQGDLKRLLAYSSVEHMGLMALGLGLGGVGTAAALLHALNHALGKTLAFFSAGRLGQVYGGYDLSRMGGALRASPLWGVGLLGSVLALVGAAPFGMFQTELQIMRAAVDRGHWGTLVLVLAGLGLAFVVVSSRLLRVVFGAPPATATADEPAVLDALLVSLPLAGLLLLGLWLPRPLLLALTQAAAVVQRGVVLP